MRAVTGYLMLLVLCLSCGGKGTENVPEPVDETRPDLKGTVAWYTPKGTDSGESQLYVCRLSGGEPVCLSEAWPMRDPRYPSFSPDGKTLLFSASESGQRYIYSYDITAGGIPSCLTGELEGDDLYPRWSRDGKSIYFEHASQVWIIGQDGGCSPLTYDIGKLHDSPTPSSDGSLVAFSTGESSSSYIGVYETGTGVSRTLADGKGRDIRPVADAQGNIYFTSGSGNGGIFRTDFSGSEMKELGFCDSNYRFTDACPSAAGWLIVSSDRGGGQGGMDLWLASAGGKAMYNLSEFAPGINSSANEYGAAFTPSENAIAVPENGGHDDPPKPSDGDNITSSTERPSLKGLLAYHNYSSYDAGDSRMYIYDFASGKLECISSSWRNVRNPMNAHFSPDGKTLTFMGIGEEGSWDIFLWRRGDSSPRNLTGSASRRDEDPKFSFDGKTIVFKRDGQLTEYTVSTGAVKTLASGGSVEYSMPYYSVDGSRILIGASSGGEDYIGLWDRTSARMSTLYDRKGVVEYYPITVDETSFYYTAHVSESNNHDQLFKGYFNGATPTSMSFNVSTADYSDAYPVGAGWLLLCSTRSGGRGAYDLYIANETSRAIYPLSDYNSSINTGLNELGPVYWSPR